MNTIPAPRVDDIPPVDVQVAIAILEAISPLYPNFAFARSSGMTVSVPEHIEAAYVAKHGEKGQWFIDVLLGRKETMASISVKVRMRLEDPEGVAQQLDELHKHTAGASED